MKIPNKFLLPSVLALSAFASHGWATPVVTSWTTNQSGQAVGDLGGVGVQFTGDFDGIVSYPATWYAPNFDNPVYGLSGGSQSIVTAGAGGSGFSHTITFDSQVLNPILWIASLGRGGSWPASDIQTWTFNQGFTILSSLYTNPVPVEGGIYQMTQSGNSLIGQEGHGAIQFSGLVSSISWTSDITEYSAFFQVGYDDSVGPPPPSVPDQGSMALLPLALGALLLGRRFVRHNSVRS